MMDYTNVGISPLMSTPMTTSYATGPTTFDTTSLMPGAFTSVPMTTQTFTTPIVDQGFALPQVTTSVLPEANPTYLPDTTFATSIPQYPVPDQALTSFIPQTTPSFIPTQEVQPMPIMTDAGLQQIPVTQDAGLQQVYVMPDAGLQQVSVMPTASVPQVSVMPTASVQQVSVMPTAGVQSVITPPPVPSPAPLTVASAVSAPGSMVPATPEMMPPTSGVAASSVPPSTQQTGPATPIMDEDFQRGRPIYDEFNEDRYRGFRFGR